LFFPIPTRLCVPTSTHFIFAATMCFQGLKNNKRSIWIKTSNLKIVGEISFLWTSLMWCDVKCVHVPSSSMCVLYASSFLSLQRRLAVGEFSINDKYFFWTKINNAYVLCAADYNHKWERTIPNDIFHILKQLNEDCWLIEVSCRKAYFFCK
jgi:hypothetical protein